MIVKLIKKGEKKKKKKWLEIDNNACTTTDYIPAVSSCLIIMKRVFPGWHQCCNESPKGRGTSRVISLSGRVESMTARIVWWTNGEQKCLPYKWKHADLHRAFLFISTSPFQGLFPTYSPIIFLMNLSWASCSWVDSSHLRQKSTNRVRVIWGCWLESSHFSYSTRVAENCDSSQSQ
jgi:hypothetical protein